MATDNFGRDVGSIDSTALISSLSSKVTNILETRDSNVEVALARIEAAVNRVAQKIDQTAAKDARESTNFALHAIQADKKSRAPRQDKIPLRLGGDTAAIRQAITGIYKMGRTPHTFWVGLGDFSSHALNQLTDALKSAGCCEEIVAATKNIERTTPMIFTGGGGGGQGPQNTIGVDDTGGGGTSGVGGLMGNLGKGFNKNVSQAINFLIASLKLVASTASEAFNIHPENAYKGMLNTASAFMEEQREINFQTEVQNKLLENQMFDWEQNYHLLRTSGQYADVVFKKMIENQRKGFELMDAKDKALYQEVKMRSGIEKAEEHLARVRANRVRHITGMALHTASMLSMNADVVNDTFYKWHQQLGLSSIEIGSMSSHMKEVAMQTGITGERLQQAMVSSEGIIKNIRNAGSISTAAMRNVIALTAEFEKFGVSEAGNQILQALSSRHSFLEADPITRGWLERIGRETGNPSVQTRIRSGTLLESPKASKEFFSGMGDDLKRMLSHHSNAIESVFASTGRKFDLATMPIEDLPKMFDVLKNSGDEGRHLFGIISDVIERQTGKSVGEIERMVEAGKEGTKTSSEKIADLTKKLNEFAAGSIKHEETQRQIRSLQIKDNQQGFKEVFKVMQDTAGMSATQIKEDLTRRLSETMGDAEAQKFVGNMGGAASEMSDVLRERAKAVDLDYDDLLQKIGGMSARDIEKGLVSGSESANQVLQDALAEIEKMEDVNADPIKAIRDSVKAIHDYLTSGLLGFFNTTIGGPLRTLAGWAAALSNPITAGFTIISLGLKVITYILSGIWSIVTTISGWVMSGVKFLGGIGSLFTPLLGGISAVGSGMTTVVDLLTSIGGGISTIVGFVSKLGGGIVDGISAVGGSIADGAKFAAEKTKGFFSGLKFWDSGTPEVTSSGLAHLHEGEAVIPKDMNPFLAQGKTGMSVAEIQKLAEVGRAQVSKSTASVIGTGAFRSDQPSEAMREGMAGSGILSLLSSAFMKVFGGAGSQVKYATGPANSMQYDTQDVTNSSIDAFGNRDELAKGFAAATEALHYLFDSDAFTKAAEASAQINDYTDDVENVRLSPNLMTYDTAEEMVARERYGESPSGSLMMPGMDVVSDYLTITQAKLLSTMTEVLIDIRTLLSGKVGSSVVGPQSGGLKSLARPGVRSLARDQTRGRWDLTYGDMSPGSVTTEGRGGSA